MIGFTRPIRALCAVSPLPPYRVLLGMLLLCLLRLQIEMMKYVSKPQGGGEPDPASRLAVLPVIGPLWRGVERCAPPVSCVCRACYLANQHIDKQVS
jgi:hypothetical protein